MSVCSNFAQGKPCTDLRCITCCCTSMLCRVRNKKETTDSWFEINAFNFIFFGVIGYF